MSKEDSKTLNIYQRLLKIKGDIGSVPKEPKGKNLYEWFSADRLNERLQPLEVKWGVMTELRIHERKQDGNRTELDATLYFINVDNPADQARMDTCGYGVDSSDKGPGKAVTYAVKIAWLKILSIPSGDDPDADQKSKHVPAKAEEKASEMLSATQKEQIAYYTQGDEKLIERILKKYQAKSLDEVKSSGFPVIMNWLQAEKGKKKNENN